MNRNSNEPSGSANGVQGSEWKGRRWLEISDTYYVSRAPGSWVVSSKSLPIVLSIKIMSILIIWFVQIIQSTNLLRGIYFWILNMLASLLLLRHHHLKLCTEMPLCFVKAVCRIHHLYQSVPTTSLSSSKQEENKTQSCI